MVLIKYRFDSDKHVNTGLIPERHSTSNTGRGNNSSNSTKSPNHKGSPSSRSPSASDVEQFNRSHSGQVFIYTPSGVRINSNLSDKSQEEARKIAGRVGWKLASDNTTSGRPSESTSGSSTQSYPSANSGSYSPSNSGVQHLMYNPETGKVYSSSGYDSSTATEVKNPTPEMREQTDKINQQAITSTGGYLIADTSTGKVYSSQTPTGENRTQTGVLTENMKEDFLNQSSNPVAVSDWGRKRVNKQKTFWENWEEKERGKSWYTSVSSVPVVGGFLAENELHTIEGFGKTFQHLNSSENTNKKIYNVSSGLLEAGGGSLNLFSTGYLIGTGGVAINSAWSGASALSGSSLSLWTKARVISAPLITYSENIIGNSAKYMAIDVASQFLGEGLGAVREKRGFDLSNVKVDLSLGSFGKMMVASGGSQAITGILGPVAGELGTVKGSALLGSIGATAFTTSYEVSSGRTENLPEKAGVSAIIGGALGGATGYAEKNGYRLAFGFKKEDIVVSQGKSTKIAGDVPYGVKFGIERVSPKGLSFYGGSIGKPDTDYLIAPKGIVETMDIATSPTSQKLVNGASYVYSKGKVNEVLLDKNLRQVSGTDTELISSGLKRTGGKLIGSTVEKSIKTPHGSLGSMKSARGLSSSDVDVQFINAPKSKIETFAKLVGGKVETGKSTVTYINYPQLADKYSIVSERGTHIDVSNIKIAPMNTPRMAGIFGEYFASSTTENTNIPHVSAQQQVATKTSTIVFGNGIPTTLESDKSKYLTDLSAMSEAKTGKKMRLTGKTGVNAIMEQELGKPLTSSSSKIKNSLSLSLPSVSSLRTVPKPKSRSSKSSVLSVPVLSFSPSAPKSPSLSIPSPSSITSSSSNKGSSGSSGSSSSSGSSKSKSSSSSGNSFSFSSQTQQSSSISGGNPAFVFNFPAPLPAIPPSAVSGGGGFGGFGTSKRAKPSKRLNTLLDSIQKTFKTTKIPKVKMPKPKTMKAPDMSLSFDFDSGMFKGTKRKTKRRPKKPIMTLW